MGRYIMKANKTDDFYVEWSTIVDAPIQWGPAAEFDAETMKPERKARADETGSSMIHPGWGDWEDRVLLVHNMGNEGKAYLLDRDNLKAFLETLGNHPDYPDVQQAALDQHARSVPDDEG